MALSFEAAVDALWLAVRDAQSLAAALANLRQLDNQHPHAASAAAVCPWFPPLLFRLLHPEQLSCILPLQPDPPPSTASLPAALLRALLLPMRAKLLNPNVTLQLVDALGYSLDASSGILAIISGYPPACCCCSSSSSPSFTYTPGDAKDFEQGFSLPPLTHTWSSGLFPWTVAAALQQRLRPCPLVHCLRLLRSDDRSLLQHLVSTVSQPHADQSLQPPRHLPPPPCALCCDAPAAVNPCSRADGSHSLCGSCAVQSLRFALSQVNLGRCKSVGAR
jgi:hypothetical protein